MTTSLFRSVPLAVSLFALTIPGAPASDTAVQAQAAVQPEVSAPLRVARSRNLRDMPRRVQTGPPRENPVRPVPRPAGPTAPQADQAVQQFMVTGMAVGPDLNFDGIGEGWDQSPYNVMYAPSDINGAIGTTQYVQWVNVSFAVFDKATGALLAGPTLGDTLWQDLGGNCAAYNDGDPIAQFDKAARRWVMTQFQVSVQPYSQCIAVSETEDATGAWSLYEYAQPQFPDYPKLAVWSDGYYVSYNMFHSRTFRFLGARACAYDRQQMLAGQPAAEICFQLSSSSGSLLPSDLDGLTPPPAGSPNVFLGFASNALRLWRFHADFASPSSSTMTGPTSLSVASFTRACEGTSRLSCIPQLGTSQRLDSLGDRVMYRLAYRNFGTHESLVVNHSVDAGGRTGVRWYEVRDPNGTPVVHQQSTYSPDAAHRWMGSVAMDQSGNLAVGYSVSSASMYPAVRFAGRESTDPLNNLTLETSIIEGTGSQTNSLSRWGDYSSISVDPVDDCTFWYTNQYLKTTGIFNWSTRIQSFKFASCNGTPTPDFQLTATPASANVSAGDPAAYTVSISDVNGFSGDVSLSTSGLPAGAAGTFTPASVTGGSGASTLEVTTNAGLADGTYPFQVVGTSGSITHAATLALVVDPPPGTGDFTLDVSPGSRNIRSGDSADYTLTVTPLGGYTGTVSFSVTGLDASMSAAFNPAGLTGGGTTTMTVATSASTPRGSYDLVVTATDGTTAHTGTATLRVR